MSREKREQERVKRGEVSQDDIAQYRNRSDDELISLLGNESAQGRTASAKLLGERKVESAVFALCRTLHHEPALYVRLAICEALVSIGEPAVDSLIGFLGKIGSNQHHELPSKGFYKRSYPLPRDIAARTLIRMGSAVLVKIEPVLRMGERYQILEAVDVVGHISNRLSDDLCLSSLLALYRDTKEDDLMKWKILRAFQAFAQQPMTDLLLEVIGTATVAPLRWEAVRSLALQARELDQEIIDLLRKDADPEIRQLTDFYFS